MIAPNLNVPIPPQPGPLLRRALSYTGSDAEIVQMRREAFERVYELTNNLETSIRTQVARFMVDGDRDINGECGYPDTISPLMYQQMYEREGAAARVVECEPEETWAMDPCLYEDEDPDTLTPFETAFNDLNTRLNVWSELQLIDELSGIGRYGVLYLGFSDGADPASPVRGVREDGKLVAGNRLKLPYVRPFEEIACSVIRREQSKRSPRYGQATLYRVQFRDQYATATTAVESQSFDVHWTRVIHVAEGRRMSSVFGTPRQKNVYNRLIDLRKIYAAGGEAFWKGAFPGMAFEVAPEVADQGIELDKDSIRAEMDEYMNGLQRYIAITGVTAKTLPPMLVNPESSVRVNLENIALTKGIPLRVLFGSEEAKLAGTQDSRAWNKRLKNRQARYVTPKIIRPFVDRLIQTGVLPVPPMGYRVEWLDLNALTDQDKSTVGLTRTQAMAQYVSGGASSLMPPDIFLTEVLGFSTEMKDQIARRMAGFDIPTSTDAEGNTTAETNLWKGLPDSGGTRTGNITGSVRGQKNKGYPRTGAQLMQEPSMNSKKPKNSVFTGKGAKVSQVKKDKKTSHTTPLMGRKGAGKGQGRGKTR
jgi:hypothetical protein